MATPCVAGGPLAITGTATPAPPSHSDGHSRLPPPQDAVYEASLPGSLATSAWTPPSALPSQDVMTRRPNNGQRRKQPQEGAILRIASLNLGGRNTNPLEFALKGDSSELALEAVAILRRAERAIVSARDGPAHMPSTERDLIEEILAAIYDGVEESTSLEEIKKLFRCETWAKVLSHVKTSQPQLFNALNLCTLTLKRPSIWEDPSSCREFSDAKDYLEAWKEWYRGLDRTSKFWREDAPRSARKRNLEPEAAFAGLLLFDVMCLCSAHCVVDHDRKESAASDAHEMPFRQISKFASQLPACSIKARHNIAEGFLHKVGAHIFFAQEARDFANHPRVVEHFWPPFCAGDGFTCVFVKRDAAVRVCDITEVVGRKMEDLVDAKASEQARKAWRTTARRLAAVQCEGDAEVGGFRMCLVSLHCSQSDHTAAFLEGLRNVLVEFHAEINVVGMDSNCSGREASEFQRRLWRAGFDIGCLPGQDQVTVAKQRTCFQTQVKKAGETDISHKDYIVSWGSAGIHRATTAYHPDLRTAYGVERESKRCVRLPTIQWPFDHCAVVTHFQPRRHILAPSSLFKSRQALASLALVCLTLAVILMPLASPDRASPYGPPGTWHRDGWDDGVRVGLCEVASEGGCAEGWEPAGSSCYAATGTRRSFDGSQAFCSGFNGSLVAIGSEAENDFVTSLCPEGEFCWIGLRGKRWLSGEPVGFFPLVESKGSLPLLGRSQRDNEPAVLSALPSEISGCHPEYLSIPTLDEPVLAAVALTLFASTVILVLPRPPRQQRKIAIYLTLSYIINLSWYSQRILGLCFASDARVIRALLASYILCDTFGRTSATMLAHWILLSRMRRLLPARAHTVVYAGMVGCMFLWMAFVVLFIDMTKAINLNSAIVLLFVTTTVVILVLKMLFCVLVSVDLYRIWDFMRREASIGGGTEGSTACLASGVRSAKIHFLSAAGAIFTGVLRVLGTLCIIVAFSVESSYPTWARYLRLILTIADSITNDLCAYFLAVEEIDDEVARARGITVAIAERARREVEQHRLAVRLLKAAPTSPEQLAHLAELEVAARSDIDGQDKASPSFLILQSVVRVETARIHRLMHCVRARSMTMPLRYQYLLDIPQVQDGGAPRQLVPNTFAAPREPTAEAAAEYFEWLYAESDGAQQVLFQQVRQLLAKFNQTPWPSDLGLKSEHFPWMIWAGGPRGHSRARLHHADAVSPGDILLHDPPGKTMTRLLSTSMPTHSIVMEDSATTVKIHRSGSESPEDVPREECRQCDGGGVFIPGPKKRRHRCLDKITADYEGNTPWPAAASLVDICRCMILLDDPYAVAVLVAYIQSQMSVVRVKNRFSEDVLELVSPEELQAMFYTAADLSDSGSTGASSPSQGSQYRDVAMSVVVPNPSSAAPIICEIQVTLANLAILKHADTKLYTIRRMQSPEELRTAYVFSEPSKS